jgi:VIT1/CCC1 family predicted Fe2+/Mn2+ transporter
VGVDVSADGALAAGGVVHPELHTARDVARHYLGDLVYGAIDGLITTFAVAAGVAGAALSPAVVIVLGVANLVADGFSMAAGNSLAIRSRGAVERAEGKAVSEPYAARHGLATLVAFVVAGSVPLLAFVVGVPPRARFTVATCLTLATLFGAGAARWLVVGGRWWVSGAEMLAVGAAAAGVAFAIGRLLAGLGLGG